MELINSTRMAAGYTLGAGPDGRELLIIVAKGTFRIPVEPGAPLTLHEEQVPLVMSDVFFGEPGLSAPRYEVDFVPAKARCDVLLNGSAYAPGGQPVERVGVGIRIGAWSKSLSVVGDRAWFDAAGLRSTLPEPFTVMPISYDRAFGGVDEHHEDPAQQAVFMPNPIGRGFHRHLVPEWIGGSPLPNTEETHEPVTRPDGSYRPMAFGALGRHWDPRYRYAGTYDQRWLEEGFPFLPADFDAQYYQSAPLDQQLELPAAQQDVVLTNLTPDGQRSFVIPAYDAPVHVFRKGGGEERYSASLDTMLFEPDEERVLLTWRVCQPIVRSIFEISQVLVGHGTRAWWRAHRSGKAYYASLETLRKMHEPE